MVQRAKREKVHSFYEKLKVGTDCTLASKIYAVNHKSRMLAHLNNRISSNAFEAMLSNSVIDDDAKSNFNYNLI